jgi:hypothetical protein
MVLTIMFAALLRAVEYRDSSDRSLKRHDS